MINSVHCGNSSTLNDGDPLLREYPFKEIIMGRPIQKKWFGPATGTGSQIVVSGVKFADGTTATSDFIIKQTGSNAYVVQDSALSHDAEIVFMVNATDVGDLNPGECFILATPFGGSALPCAKIAQYRVDLFEADGSVASYSWSTIPAAAPGEADLITGSGGVGALLTLAVDVAGSGYFTAPAVTLTGGGTGGAAHVTVAGATGVVATAVIDSAGWGYSGVSVAAPPASVTAVLTPTLTNGVLSLVVANAAANGYYNAVPAVTVAAPPAATTATATATISAGQVNGYITLVGGGYYPAIPLIAVGAPPAPVTATATPPLNDGADGVTLGALVITAAGGYYSVEPVVTLGGGNGDAVAVATVANGVVTGVTVTGAGTGFVGLVTVSIAVPDVAPVQAVLSAVLTNGAVTSISRDTLGAGYLAAPGLVFDAPPAAVAGAATATLTAHRVTSVAGVTGSGYFTAPVVSVAAANVAPVQATLTATFSV